MKIHTLVTVENLGNEVGYDEKFCYFLHAYGYLKLYSFGEELVCEPGDFYSACAKWIAASIVQNLKDCETL